MYSASYRAASDQTTYCSTSTNFPWDGKWESHAHIKEFEDVCNTFQEGGTSIDLMRLKLFPFTLKDKANIWLNSLRPTSIRTWTDLQAEFLKKFFPTHRTNGLKSKFQTSQLKRMRNSISVGKDTWKPSMLVLTMVLIHGYWWVISMMGCLPQ